MFGPAAGAQTFTTLQQLTQALATNQVVIGKLDLEATVCAASDARMGVLIVHDASGVELLQLGDLQKDFQPGERIRIQSEFCLLRRRETGVQISTLPIVRNDGLHAWTGVTRETFLRAGRIPVRLEWFNYWRQFGLEVLYSISNEPPHSIPATNLWHAVVDEAGTTNFLPGLLAECFEGTWESLPDFNLLQSAKTAVVPNFDLGIKSRAERVGIRYSGYLDIPQDGRYRISLWSDDGSMLFLGDPRVPVLSLGRGGSPLTLQSEPSGAPFSNMDERRWIAVEGRVNFVTRMGTGLRFDLGTARQVVSVFLADATGLDVSTLPNSRVRIAGVGRAIMAADQSLILGKLFAASAASLTFIEPALGTGAQKLPLTSVAQVQGLPIEAARQALPVRIRGTVTGGVNTSQERWMSFQDDTRGIFVRLTGISNAIPASGELWELEGHSGAGDFAPVIIANRITRLGEGLLPAPVTPTWAALLNGSRDVQWAELKGLVTEVRSNTISLHLPEGRLEVELEGSSQNELQPFLKSVVKIRGVLYAVWNAATREVRVGQVMMRNATISVDTPAPMDPFDAVLRTPRELLLFDAQASAFRPVKVRGQIVYADATKLFLQAEETGMRLLPMGKTEARPGDLVEVVGYPDIASTELVLREALVKTTGQAPLPPAKKLADSTSSQLNLNSTRVQADGKLLGWHIEESGPVLEMQSGARLYLARIASGKSSTLSLRPGSRLALEGVYVGRRHAQGPDSDTESFELLMNSPDDVTVLSQPSWWTLPRMLALLALLLVFLVVIVIWNTQLRRQVEQRTAQLHHEIRERERLERQAALETERSRIARDLHDDLGSSLTEISVLASTGQLPQSGGPTSQSTLFQSIGTRARGLIAALDVIVWAVDPEDNSLQSLADYLTGYTNDFFSHTQIACRFKVPVSFPPITLEGRVRHDLLMAVKESLNNVVRHAEATELEFRLAVVNDRLEIDIADNGKGIATGADSGGHGLKNLSARLKKLGGQCTVEPRGSRGTIVKIRLPLAVSGGAISAPAAKQ
jgi:signal transduction histidine kinase